MKGKVSSLSFPIRQSIPDLSWITDAAILLRIPAVKGSDHVIIVYFFNSARTPNSFFIDCFSFERLSNLTRFYVFKYISSAYVTSILTYVNQIEGLSEELASLCLLLFSHKVFSKRNLNDPIPFFKRLLYVYKYSSQLKNLCRGSDRYKK